MDDDDDDIEAKQARRVAKLSKHFQSKEIWIAAFCVWKGIKAYFDTSNKAFGPSTDMHIARIGRMCSTYGWERVLNYEIAFFQRYATIRQPEHVWALHDNQLAADFLQMGLPRPGLPMSSKLSTPNSNKDSFICHKFNSGKKCNPNICRYQHRCTFDATRCSGSHPAAICPLNPNKQHLQDRIANYKIPVHVLFVNSFPMTASGKIQKFAMTEMTPQLIRQQLTE